MKKQPRINPITVPERTGNEEDIIAKAIRQAICDLRVACPGIIQSFDSAKQTVTVKLAIREDIIQDGIFKKGIEIDILYDVPIVMPRAGKFALTLPVTPGDECLIIFGDNCIDGWRQSSGVQNQIDKRRHDLSDGFAILAPWSQPKVISGYSTDTTQLRDLEGTTYVEIADSGVINITGAATINAEAPTVNITGANLVNIEANENTKIEGRVFLNHVHKNVEPGSGNTGGVL